MMKGLFILFHFREIVFGPVNFSLNYSYPNTLYIFPILFPTLKPYLTKLSWKSIFSITQILKLKHTDLFYFLKIECPLKLFFSLYIFHPPYFDHYLFNLIIPCE